MRHSAHQKPKAHPVAGLFVLFGLTLLAFGLWKVIPTLKLPTQSRFERTNIILAGRQVVLVSVNNQNNSAVVIMIPDELYIHELIHGLGQYKAASVYPVGQIDRRGGEVLRGTMREFLGVPIDGYYFTNRPFSDAKNFFISTDFIFANDSNLDFIKRIEFAKGLTSVRFDKVKTVDLEKFASQLLLADGSSALNLEKVEVDQIISGLLTEDGAVAENYRIEVINSTKTVGLGARVVRVLTNLGLTVVNVDSEPVPIPKCIIKTDNTAKSSKTALRIKNIYGCSIETGLNGERAQVRVILGQDYADWLEK